MRATNKTIAFAVMAICALLAGCQDKPAEDVTIESVTVERGPAS